MIEVTFTVRQQLLSCVDSTQGDDNDSVGTSARVAPLTTRLQESRGSHSVATRVEGEVARRRARHRAKPDCSAKPPGEFESGRRYRQYRRSVSREPPQSL